MVMLYKESYLVYKLISCQCMWSSLRTRSGLIRNVPVKGHRTTPGLFHAGSMSGHGYSLGRGLGALPLNQLG